MKLGNVWRPAVVAACLATSLVGVAWAVDPNGPCSANPTDTVKQPCAFVCTKNAFADNEWFASSDTNMVPRCQNTTAPVCDPDIATKTCTYIVYSNSTCSSQPVRTVNLTHPCCALPGGGGG